MGSLIGRRRVCIGRLCGGWIALRGGLIFVVLIKMIEEMESIEDEARMKWCIPENVTVLQQHGIQWRLLGSYEDLI